MIDVLIVGGGPTGLTMSLLLARHGVEALLVERRAGPSALPRARGIHARAAEILRVLGVLDDLRSVALPIRPGVEWRTVAAAEPDREATFPPEPEPSSPCDGVAVAQDVFEEVLRAHATGVQDNTALVGLEIGADSVTAALSGGRTIRSRFLIAADGARSLVRSRLGIPMTGRADLGRQRTVHFRADLSPWLGDRPRGLYFLTSIGGVLFGTHPDHRWVLSVPASASDENLLERALGSARPPAAEILGVREWTATARNADTYRRGPVFLTGDAAHSFPPAGATGVSTALHDVHNLAWKLALVLSGRAGPELLDTYEAERRPVAARNVTETAAEWRRLTDPAATPFPGRDLRQIDMGYQYRSPAIIPDGSPDADPPGAF
jgi:putative polyketide hydroxylase